MKVHLDTDIGGDVDDLCALAMLLKMPEIELTGITTVAEEGGRRAAFVHEVLRLAGSPRIPVAAGADVGTGGYRYDRLEYPSDARNWGKKVAPRPNPIDHALEQLRQSLAQGATVVAIGPFTNLSLLEQAEPGILRDADLWLMGGYVFDVPDAYPTWRREDDWNVQLDVPSARCVLASARPTLVPLTVSTQTAVGASALPALRASGPLGQLLACQLEHFAEVEGMAERYGRMHRGLPDDLINFLHDPLAAAIACGWRDGVTIETHPLRIEERGGYLYERVDASGRETRIVTQIDPARFDARWLEVVCS